MLFCNRNHTFHQFPMMSKIEQVPFLVVPMVVMATTSGLFWVQLAASSYSYLRTAINTIGQDWPMIIRSVQSGVDSKYTVKGDSRNVMYWYTIKEASNHAIVHVRVQSILNLSTMDVHFTTFCHFYSNHSSFNSSLYTFLTMLHTIYTHSVHVWSKIYTSVHFIVPMKHEHEQDCSPFCKSMRSDHAFQLRS